APDMLRQLLSNPAFLVRRLNRSDTQPTPSPLFAFPEQTRADDKQRNDRILPKRPLARSAGTNRNQCMCRLRKNFPECSPGRHDLDWPYNKCTPPIDMVCE